MTRKTQDEQTLRKYLLGDMSLQEQEELELWLMSNEEAYDLLVAAEDDLIDDSLSGKLQEHECRGFNEHFLAAPERQRKLQFGRSLHRLVKASGNMSARTPAFSVLNAVLNALQYRPQIAYAFAVVIVAVAVGGLWSAFRFLELQRQLRSATEQLATAELDRNEFKRQLSESQSLSEKLEAQLQTLQQTAGGANSSLSPTLLALNLLPGISRSSGNIPNITLTANSGFIRLTLILLDDNYNSYNVTLLDSNGKRVLTKDGISATVSGNGKAVIVTVPSDLLSGGDYTASLAGVSDSRPPENISSFYFRAVRQ